MPPQRKDTSDPADNGEMVSGGFQVNGTLQASSTRELLIMVYGELGHVRESLNNLLRDKTVSDRKLQDLEICIVRTEGYPDALDSLGKRISALDARVTTLAESLAGEKGTQKASHRWIDWIIQAAITGVVALLVYAAAHAASIA